ncbi:MAG TPA: hypothetical protein V6D09_20560 [Leptolyngbyaceae cyanobacterium]
MSVLVIFVHKLNQMHGGCIPNIACINSSLACQFPKHEELTRAAAVQQIAN